MLEQILIGRSLTKSKPRANPVTLRSLLCSMCRLLKQHRLNPCRGTTLKAGIMQLPSVLPVGVCMSFVGEQEANFFIGTVRLEASTTTSQRTFVHQLQERHRRCCGQTCPIRTACGSEIWCSLRSFPLLNREVVFA